VGVNHVRPDLSLAALCFLSICFLSISIRRYFVTSVIVRRFVTPVAVCLQGGSQNVIANADPPRRRTSVEMENLRTLAAICASPPEAYMKVLLVSSPAMGHLHPLLGVGRILISDSHEVMGLSSSFLRSRIKDMGARFRSFVPEADIDTRNVAALFPELKATPRGPELLRLILERAFVDFMLPQYESIKKAMREFPADIIIGDHLMVGVLPLLLGPRSERPPVVLLGTTYLISHRDDGAPNDAGAPLATGDEQRQEHVALFQKYEEIVFGPVGNALNERLSQIGIKPLHMNLYDAMVELPDSYLQLTVPRFEFPRCDLAPSVRFVGPLPITPNQAAVPSWERDLDGSCKVVLVTQGTLTNDDFSELVTPTLEALANEPDILVMVTTGGRPIETLRGPLPENVRVAEYLPFEWAMSKINAFVTNGGYGSVNQALSFGVPVVTAGTVADRGDVGARVAWSGVGVNLATNAPTPDALRSAVRRILDEPTFREQAALFADEARSIDTRSEVLQVLKQLVLPSRRQAATASDTTRKSRMKTTL
jgi:UDP:flavonoid glycosyltransferase YjiC (YdhE family)